MNTGTEWPEDRRLTHHDLEHTPEDGNRYEVIDGELHVTPSPGFAHERAIHQLFWMLDSHVRAHGSGLVLTAGLKIVLDVPSGVVPDLIYISNDRLDGMRPDGFYGAPDLLVEVISTKPGLDRLVKYGKYARAGVPHYSIIDPAARTLSAFRLRGSRYERVAEHRDAEHFAPELFPGLTIDLAALWVA